MRVRLKIPQNSNLEKTGYRGLRSKRTDNNAKPSNFMDKIVESYSS
jgi:hypothetical protein